MYHQTSPGAHFHSMIIVTKCPLVLVFFAPLIRSFYLLCPVGDWSVNTWIVWVFPLCVSICYIFKTPKGWTDAQGKKVFYVSVSCIKRSSWSLKWTDLSSSLFRWSECLEWNSCFSVCILYSLIKVTELSLKIKRKKGKKKKDCLTKSIILQGTFVGKDTGIHWWSSCGTQVNLLQRMLLPWKDLISVKA